MQLLYILLWIGETWETDSLVTVDMLYLNVPPTKIELITLG